MTQDRTEHQSDEQLRRSRKLSVQPTRPPAKIEGYTIQDFVGRGSYGEVWTAIDQKTGKRVAIKFYAQRSNSDVKQLAQEVEKLVVLAADRYVVQLLDVGWDATPPYYVMDYIDHGSLEDRIKSGEPMEVDRAVEVFRDVAMGLMHLHGKGILHCDLKPGNVLLDQDGNPRLADFGQSRLQTDSTSALGTLFYMAPEQANLEAMPDARWDVYGLGALLFTMLTGRPPYYSDQLKSQIESAETLPERLKLYRRALTAAKSPREHRRVPGVDRGLADVIDQCIAAKPGDRFASAESVVDALRLRDFKKERRPLMLLGILGPLVLLSFMSGFGWYAFRQATSKAEEAILTQSAESNRFAAELAASSAAEQLDEYFRVVLDLSRDRDFTRAFVETIESESLATMRRQLSDPNRNMDPVNATVRERFRSHPSRQKLQPFLEKRMSDPNGEYPDAASWFITDRQGNQLAGVFDSGKSDTIGKNYSFRTYFTGEQQDIKGNRKAERAYPVAEDPNQRKIISEPHLSASFPSEASGLWKVAFSAPVLHPQTAESIGIVAVTVNLGSLVDFRNSLKHYVMLVDDRPGENRGVILEHPLFNQLRKDNPADRLPDDLTNITLDVGVVDGQRNVPDPVGGTELGENYDREYIVASIPVAFSSHSVQLEKDSRPENASTQSGLHVLAFEDYQAVVDPSRKLSAGLSRLAMWAILILASVAFAMWFLVARLFREANRKLFATASGGGAATSRSISVASSRSESSARSLPATQKEVSDATIKRPSERSD